MKLTSKQVGEVGEHWVLYRLIREGYTAVLAPKNADAVDILAADKHGRAFSIQVKTKTNARGWRLDQKDESRSDPRLFYCLVDLGKNCDREPPEAYVVPSRLALRFVKHAHAGWLTMTKANGDPHKDSTMRVLEDSYGRLAPVIDMDEYPEGWLERYRENWDILGTDAAIHQGAQSPKFAARSPRPPFNKQPADLGRADYSWVEGGKLKVGWITHNIGGNSKRGDVPESEDYAEEVTAINPAYPGHNGQEYKKLTLKMVDGPKDMLGKERNKFLSTAKKVEAKPKD
jgi:hypothetical protein